MCFRPPSVSESGESVCSFCGEQNTKGSWTCASCGRELLKVPEAAKGISNIPAVPNLSGSTSFPKGPPRMGQARPPIPKAPNP